MKKITYYELFNSLDNDTFVCRALKSSDFEPEFDALLTASLGKFTEDAKIVATTLRREATVPDDFDIKAAGDIDADIVRSCAFIVHRLDDGESCQNFPVVRIDRSGNHYHYTALAAASTLPHKVLFNLISVSELGKMLAKDPRGTLDHAVIKSAAIGTQMDHIISTLSEYAENPESIAVENMAEKLIRLGKSGKIEFDTDTYVKLLNCYYGCHAEFYSHEYYEI